MSETTGNIESEQPRRSPGTPVTGDILKRLLYLDRREKIMLHLLAGTHIEVEDDVFHVELCNRDGYVCYLLRHPSNPGMLLVYGPKFFEIDPDKPETFEFLELVIKDEDFLTAIKDESDDVRLEEEINKVSREAKRVSTPQPTCSYCLYGNVVG